MHVWPELGAALVLLVVDVDDLATPTTTTTTTEREEEQHQNMEKSQLFHDYAARGTAKS